MCARTNPVVTVGHDKQQAVCAAVVVVVDVVGATVVVDVVGATVVVDVVGAAVVVTGAVVSGDVVDVP